MLVPNTRPIPVIQDDFSSPWLTVRGLPRPPLLPFRSTPLSSPSRHLHEDPGASSQVQPPGNSPVPLHVHPTPSSNPREDPHAPSKRPETLRRHRRSLEPLRTPSDPFEHLRAPSNPFDDLGATLRGPVTRHVPRVVRIRPGAFLSREAWYCTCPSCSFRFPSQGSLECSLWISPG